MLRTNENARVVAVSKSSSHTISKSNCDSIYLLVGIGVEGDAHSGETVKHRSRVRIDPTQPNLRQVHIIHNELLDDLKKQGFRVGPGVLGENITTTGIDLLELPRETVIQFGPNSAVRVTGLRNPCRQLDQFQSGLLDAVLERTEFGELIRKAGIVGIVTEGGHIKPGDAISVTLPNAPYQKLDRV